MYRLIFLFCLITPFIVCSSEVGQNDIGGDISFSNLADIAPGSSASSSNSKYIAKVEGFIYVLAENSPSTMSLIRYDANNEQEVLVSFPLTRGTLPTPFYHNNKIAVPFEYYDSSAPQNTRVGVFLYNLISATGETVYLDYRLDQTSTSLEYRFVNFSNASIYFDAYYLDENLEPVSFRLIKKQGDNETAFDFPGGQVTPFSQGVVTSSGYYIPDEGEPAPLTSTPSIIQVRAAFNDYFLATSSDNDLSTFIWNLNDGATEVAGLVRAIAQDNGRYVALLEDGESLNVWEFTESGAASLSEAGVHFSFNYFEKDSFFDGETFYIFHSKNGGSNTEKTEVFAINVATGVVQKIYTIDQIIDLRGAKRFNGKNYLLYSFRYYDSYFGDRYKGHVISSDGTQENTALVSSIENISHFEYVQGLGIALFDDKLLYPFESENSGHELIALDTDGTEQHLDFTEGEISSFANVVASFDDEIILRMFQPEHGRELYRVSRIDASPLLITNFPTDSTQDNSGISAVFSRTDEFKTSLLLETGVTDVNGEPKVFVTDGKPSHSWLLDKALPCLFIEDKMHRVNLDDETSATSIDLFDIQDGTFAQGNTLIGNENLANTILPSEGGVTLFYEYVYQEDNTSTTYLWANNNGEEVLVGEFSGSIQYLETVNQSVYFMQNNRGTYTLQKLDLSASETVQLSTTNSYPNWQIIPFIDSAFVIEGRTIYEDIGDELVIHAAGEVVVILSSGVLLHKSGSVLENDSFSFFSFSDKAETPHPFSAVYNSDDYFFTRAKNVAESFARVTLHISGDSSDKTRYFVLNSDSYTEIRTNPNSYLDIGLFTDVKDELFILALESSLETNTKQTRMMFLNKELDILDDSSIESPQDYWDIGDEKLFKVEGALLFTTNTAYNSEIWLKTNESDSAIKVVNIDDFVSTSDLVISGSLSFMDFVNGRLVASAEGINIGREPYVIDTFCYPSLNLPTVEDSTIDFATQQTQKKIPLNVKSVKPILLEQLSATDTENIEVQIIQENGEFVLVLEASSNAELNESLNISVQGICGLETISVNVVTQQDAVVRGRVAFDYDGDNKADIAIRSADGQLFALRGVDTDFFRWVNLGKQTQDIPVSGDFDDDGIADAAVFRPSTNRWYVKNSSGTHFNSTRNDDIQRVDFGHSTEVYPVPADYDGDGITDFAFRRPDTSTWYIINSSGSNFNSDIGDGRQRVLLGLRETDIPVQGDYDGDGKADPAVYRESNHTWYVRNSSGTTFNSTRDDDIQRIKFAGEEHSVVAPADYDGDGIMDPAFYNTSSGEFKVLLSTSKKERKYNVLYKEDAVPMPADYDGDGKADPAVFSAKYNQSAFWLSATQRSFSVTFDTASGKRVPVAAPLSARMNIQ